MSDEVKCDRYEQYLEIYIYIFTDILSFPDWGLYTVLNLVRVLSWDNYYKSYWGINNFFT